MRDAVALQVYRNKPNKMRIKELISEHWPNYDKAWEAYLMEVERPYYELKEQENEIH